MALIEYDESDADAYGAWASRMILQNGFNLPVSELMQTLKVKRTFIKNHLQHNPNIRYINLSHSWARNYLVLGGSFDRVYFNRSDVVSWLMNDWTYRVRSHFIDLADFCPLALVNTVCENLNLQCGYRYRSNILFDGESLEGWIDPRILINLGVTTENVNEIHREDLGFLTVEPVNLLIANLHHPKEDFNSTELAYRSAARHGWIHCCYGTHKTIFAEVEHECTVPFLIPANVDAITFR